MTLVADAAGVLSGKFMIPANIPAGTKAVRAVTGGGLNAVAGFTGRGVITTEQRRRVTTINTIMSFDPLAQTFILQESRHVPGVDLWFSNAGDKDVLVQIRNVEAGVPGKTVIAEARIKPSAITTVGHTRVLFPAPVWLDAGVELAVVVLTDSATTALRVAELTKFDADAQRWITQQAYQIGTLLSSSNASTWTAHQNKDLTFRLLGCKFTATDRTIALGSATLVDASDMIAQMNVDIPATGVSAEVRATAPDGTVYRMTPDTPIALPTRINGAVAMSVVLSGTDKFSPVLYPGIQLVAGDQEASGQYVSRAFPVGTTARVSITFEARTPGLSTVGCEIQKQDGTWQALTLTSGTDAGDGWVERNYTVTGFTATVSRVRLTLTGTTAARPSVRKLRAVATD